MGIHGALAKTTELSALCWSEMLFNACGRQLESGRCVESGDVRSVAIRSLMEDGGFAASVDNG